ncbi:hypothetical protein [Streptomyces sp. NPDC002491]
MTVHAFAVALRQLKVWQRNPTYQKIANVSARHNLAVGQTTICNVFRGAKLPTENALMGVLISMGLSPRDPEFTEWVEKRRELEAARVESSLEPPPDDDTSRTGGFTPLHKKRAPIPRQRGPTAAATACCTAAGNRSSPEATSVPCRSALVGLSVPPSPTRASACSQALARTAC